MKNKLKSFGVGAGLVFLILALVYGASWLITCGIIKLITMCFGWEFTWATATGVWLIIVILKSIFNHNTTVNNK